MPGIEQIKISLPSKILRVKVDFCRGPPRHGAGAPLHLHQQGLHCYPFSSQLVLNLTLALSWVQRGHLLKLCYKGHIRVLHLTVHELAFGGRNREKTE